MPKPLQFSHAGAHLLRVPFPEALTSTTHRTAPRSAAYYSTEKKKAHLGCITLLSAGEGDCHDTHASQSLPCTLSRSPAPARWPCRPNAAPNVPTRRADTLPTPRESFSSRCLAARVTVNTSRKPVLQVSQRAGKCKRQRKENYKMSD